jgi:hypothetical protein
MRVPIGLLCLGLPICALAAGPALDSPGVAIQANKDKIDFLVGKELVGRYNIGADVVKPYLWPLSGPAGVPVTRAWPMVKPPAPGGSTDHVHQKSVWFCHGDVIPEGIPLKEKAGGVEGVDFWAEGRGHGKIVCVKVDEPKQEKDHGGLRTVNEWRTLDDTKILDEVRTIQLYDFGDARLFVFDIDLQASVCPITFGDTKEGSFGIRVNDAIREEKGSGKIENADGKVGEKACWGFPSAWCDYSGTIDGKKVGLAILADPTNAYPSCWHARAYGLMAANPFGRGKSGFPAMKGRTDLVKLAKGEHLKLRFGLLLHPGDAKEGKVAEYFDRFVKLKG